MSASSQPRTPSKLSDSVHHQLSMYALAASAAGVGMMALTQSAEAKIVYTKTHKVIGFNGVYSLDLNHDGIIAFLILDHVSGFGFNALFAKEAYGNAVQGYAGENTWINWASALKRGVRIGGGQRFVKGGYYGEGMVSYFGTENGAGTAGPWVNVTNRYLGLKFQIKGKTHYGWARLSVRVQRPKITATLTGYAYETVPGKSILAGQISGDVGEAGRGPDALNSQGPGLSDSSSDPDSATTPTSSLGRLALGAQAVPVRRQP